MKNINIPEPCSEDWSKMTPNEKGAFCQKCALDVYDFTNKSADEIREVLTLNMANPVCMRIEPKQLDQLNADYSAWRIQNKRSYDRAWIFTLLVVFGMTLFSCQEDEEPVVKEYQKIGQSILSEDAESKDFKKGESTNILEKETELVQELVEPPMTNEVIMGLPAPDGEEELIITEQVIIDDVVTLKEEVYHTAGIPRISHDYDEYLLEVNPNIHPDELEITSGPSISGLVYPNPAANETTLQVEMTKRDKVEIELWTLNGQKIRTIHSGRIKRGGNKYTIDVSNLETGMYLVVVYSGEAMETIKFTKI